MNSFSLKYVNEPCKICGLEIQLFKCPHTTQELCLFCDSQLYKPCEVCCDEVSLYNTNLNFIFNKNGVPYTNSK